MPELVTALENRPAAEGGLVRLALLGAPNCGKTSLFNALTGGRAKVANYPGVTVEYRKGIIETESAMRAELLDLPGVYGDCGHSLDERVAIDAIRGNIDGERAPDGIVFVVDASHITTHLHNVLQAKNYGLPIVLVLNMMDMAARDGLEIDINGLEEKLGIPVVSCVAVRSSGRSLLTAFLDNWVGRLKRGEGVRPEAVNLPLKEMQAQARAITRETVTQNFTADTITDKIDKIVLHPVLGTLILVAILFLMFQAVFAWAGPPADMILGAIEALKSVVESFLPEGWLRSLIADGIIEGVGAVIVFLPQIIILFAFILALEASGYMARAAFLIDTLMAKVGLNGRAFIPLLSSFACAIPGIMAARTIEGERDRLTTILIAPLMTCSARWPVYLLIIAAFIPNTNVGPFGLQGLVGFSLVITGIIFALIAAFVLKRTLTKGAKPSLLLELPSYKMPSLKDYLLGLWERAKIFISRAGRIILPASIIIWFLSSYPNQDEGIRSTFAGMIGGVLEPLFSPIGFTLEMVISLIPAMAAREVAVSSLATIYSLDASVAEDQLGSILAASWSLPTALAFLAWFVFAPQCLSTLAIMKKETNGWKWPIFAFSYLFVLAYVAAGLTYHAARAFGL
jgi:ferrous iron transport protein B